MHTSEFDAQKHEFVKETWDEIQGIRIRMYEAIDAAIEETSAPFLKEIEEAEAAYAAMLRMVS